MLELQNFILSPWPQGKSVRGDNELECEEELLKQPKPLFAVCRHRTVACFFGTMQSISLKYHLSPVVRPL